MVIMSIVHLSSQEGENGTEKVEMFRKISEIILIWLVSINIASRNYLIMITFDGFFCFIQKCNLG